ncbi:hypothetical protein JCM24511_00031 [Saitozyma sp. JCM 24511]|nr:hypothetical protein JCM24511_00031 [Saitozyma sp. JCM 24511]
MANADYGASKRPTSGGPVTAAENTKTSDESKRPLKHHGAVSVVVVALAVGALAFRQELPSLDFEFLTRPPHVVPPLAQVIDQKAFNVLGAVPPPSEAHGTSYFFPPGTDRSSLKAKPFHIYDDDFYSIVGAEPTLTLIAETSGNPLFHEANVWYPETDEMFFVQNAGAPAAGTGLKQSSIIQKISLAQADAVKHQINATGMVNVVEVDSNPQVINPNGATNYRGKIVFTGEGQGDVAPALFLMEPTEPYNTTVLLDNYYGRQFNSLNDVAVNPRNKELYFTDVSYGYLQDFRPQPVLPNQVYRYNPRTGAVTVVADGFKLVNGITFSPSGSLAYVTETGANRAFHGWDYSEPSAIYQYDVELDGTWSNRKLFAFVDSGVPDGVHCDAAGNVYAGCGDGVTAWNASGKLLGKIYLGEVAANFQFAGKGRMVICAETKLYYATLAASGAPITDYKYSGTY